MIGFVTSGNYDLGAGKGAGVGCVLWARVREAVAADLGKGKGVLQTGRLCVVREAGMSVARLASWDVV